MPECNGRSSLFEKCTFSVGLDTPVAGWLGAVACFALVCDVMGGGRVQRTADLPGPACQAKTKVSPLFTVYGTLTSYQVFFAIVRLSQCRAIQIAKEYIIVRIAGKDKVAEKMPRWARDGLPERQCGPL